MAQHATKALSHSLLSEDTTNLNAAPEKGWSNTSECLEDSLPASSDEVLRWLFGQRPSLERLEAAAAWARIILSEDTLFFEGARWQIALCQATLGLVALEHKEYSAALSYFEGFRWHAVEQFGASSQAAADAEMCLGRACFLRGSYDQALMRYERAIDSAFLAALPNRPHLVRVLEDMLNAYEHQANFEQVCVFAEHILDYWKQADVIDTVRLLQVVIRASNAHALLASGQEATQLLKYAWSFLPSTAEGYAAYEVALLLTQALVKAQEGVFVEATQYLLQAQAIGEGSRDVPPQLQAELLIVGAELSLLQRAFGLAEQYLRRYEQLRTANPFDNARLQSRAMAVQGRLMQGRGELENAAAVFLSGISLLTHQGRLVPESAMLREYLAELYLQKAQADSAIAQWLEAAREYAFVFSQDHPSTLRVYVALAKAYSRKGTYSLASSYLDFVMSMLQAPAAQTYSLQLLLVEALEVKATLLLNLYRKTEQEEPLAMAWAAVQSACAKVLSIRQSVHTTEQWLSLHHRFERIAELGISVAYQQYACCNDNQWLEDAFSMAQSGKEFVWEPVAFRRLYLKMDMVKRSRYLYAHCLEQTVKYQQTLAEATLEVRASLLDLTKGVLKADSAYYNNRSNFLPDSLQRFLAYTPVSVHGITTQMKKREVLLDYYVGAEAVYVFILSKYQPLDLVEIPLDFDLKSLIHQTVSAIVGRTERMRSFYEPAYELYLRIFQPVEQRFPRRPELIAVIPHSYLSDIPFEALLTTLPKPQKADRVCAYDYLVKRYAFYYAYSANHWKASASAAGPWWERQSYVIIPSDDKLTRGLEEARQVSRLLGSAILDRRLTKKQVLDSLSKGYIVHIVGHSLAAQGSVIHWRGLSGDSSDHLYVPDVLAQPLRASLVGLSACETALPSHYHPYGLSMARAFSYAGAACVIGANWAIEDASSQRIMQDFYELLRKRKTDSKPQALQAAQKSFFSGCGSARGHPYYWAGWRLFGNASAFERPERRAIRGASRMVRKALRRLPSAM